MVKVWVGVLQLNNNGAVASTASILEFPDKENCFLVDPIRNLITTGPRQKTDYIFIRSCSCKGEASYGSHEFYINVGASKSDDVEVMIRGKFTEPGMSKVQAFL